MSRYRFVRNLMGVTLWAHTDDTDPVCFNFFRCLGLMEWSGSMAHLVRQKVLWEKKVTLS
jgi:hypothetical protein